MEEESEEADGRKDKGRRIRDENGKREENGDERWLTRGAEGRSVAPYPRRKEERKRGCVIREKIGQQERKQRHDSESKRRIKI